MAELSTKGDMIQTDLAPNSALTVLSPPSAEECFRDETIEIELLSGHSLQVHVDRADMTIEELKAQIYEQHGIDVHLQRLIQDRRALCNEDIVQASDGVPLQLVYNLRGGGKGKGQIVTIEIATTYQVPEAIQIRCCCYKCGLQQLPDFFKDNICEHMCFWWHQDFGWKECLEKQQCLCAVVDKSGCKQEKSL
eukprot:gene16924-20110_t